MKICLIGPTYPFRGGISHYTTLLYRHLKKRHNVTFISFKRQYLRLLFPGKTDIDPSKKQFRENGVIPMIDSVNPFTWFKSARKILNMKPDLIIIPWWVSVWAPLFWTITMLIKIFNNSKILFLCHNVVEHESSWIDKILTKFVLKNGDLFIVHSKEDKHNLVSMFPEAIVRQNFHPTYDVFNLGDFDPEIIRKRYGIDGNIILFFGFIRKYKGLKYLIKALPEVLSKINVTLLIIGEFWKDKNEHLQLIDSLGIKEKIIIVDEYVPNEEVGLYFSVADIVVQPYISATGSGIIQIAFGFNKPVIATKVGCLPEVVEDGKTGYLVPPEDSYELAQAILKFFREGNVEEFRKNIEKENYKFSWDRMVDVIENLAQSDNPP